MENRELRRAVRGGRRSRARAGGLDKIRARIDGRQPRPGCSSVLRRPRSGPEMGRGTGMGPAGIMPARVPWGREITAAELYAMGEPGGYDS